MKDKIDKFKSIVIENFSKEDFQYHEWMGEYHLEIVERIAMELCDVYAEADRDIVQAMVWFHDFGKPFNEEKEREITLEKGPEVMLDCGFSKDFIGKVIEYWKLMEKKNEIDIKNTPIEVQIVSSADGASHFVGVFHASYFGDGNDFKNTQKNLQKKIEQDWSRKMVLPETRNAFEGRYKRSKELLGEFPDNFLK